MPNFLASLFTLHHHTWIFSFVLASTLRPTGYCSGFHTASVTEQICLREKDIDVLFHLISPHIDLSKLRDASEGKISSCRGNSFSGYNGNNQIRHGLSFRSTQKPTQDFSNHKDSQSSYWTDIKEWLNTLDQPYLLQFPIDSSLKNEVRVVHRVIFSKIFPTPFKMKTRLAAVSESALADCLDFDLTFASSPLFQNMISGDYIGKLARLVPEPLAHRYGGHQFGYWASQLGDGRAHLIGCKVNRNLERWELQLKGSGRTPYSRQGDGRAVLRSSVREFLASEAMYYLGIPTSRAATLVISEDVFARDQFYDGNVIYERGAIVMRLAPSWFRFGSLEILTKSGEFDLLKSLTDFVIKQHFPQIDSSSPERYLMFFEEVVIATAHMIAYWQSVGFTHGVCNTDNFSLLSITIDYGPFGFMDTFDPKYVPNTSDDEGRYSYEKQPDIGLFNLDKLKQALFPLWDSSQRQIAEIILKGYSDHFKMKYLSLFTKKLGLRHVIRDQDQILIEMFLQIMQESKSDFTLTFRHLGNLSLKKLTSKNLKEEYWTIKLIQKHPLYDSFLKMYSRRFEMDGTNEKNRQLLMSQSNPQYVLRNWMAERAINLAEQNDFSGIKLLYQILKNPFVKQEEAEKDKFANKPPSWASHIRVSCSS